MSRLLIYFILFLFTSALNAQQTDWKKELNALPDKTGKVVWIINAFVENRYPQNKAEMLEVGFKIAEPLHNDSLLGKLYSIRGFYYVSISRVADGWKEYERARPLLIKSKAYDALGRTMSNQAWALLIQGLSDSVLHFLDRNRPLISRNASARVLLTYDANYGTAYNAMGQYDLAAKKYKEAIGRAWALKDTGIFAANCINLGSVQPTFDSAMFWFRKASDHMKGTGSSLYPEALLQIAYLFMQQDGVIRDSTIFYLKLAEQYQQDLRSDLNRNNLYNLMGSYFYSKGEFKLALAAFHKAYRYFKEEGKNSNMVINNIALCHVKLNHPDSVAIYIGKFKDVMNRLGGDDYEQMLYHQSLAEYYVLTTKDSCSLKGVKEEVEALELAAKIGETRIGFELLLASMSCVLGKATGNAQWDALGKKLLVFCDSFYKPLKQEEKLYNYSRFLARYAALEVRYGSKENALILFNENTRVSERMVEQQYMSGMNEAMIKYKSDLKDAEIALLNQKERAAGIRVIFVASGLILVTSVLVLIYILYRRENKSKHLLDERNHKVEQLLREVHHRVKNNLQIVSSFINIQLDKVKDDEATEALKDTSTRIMALAGLHQSLYRQGDLSRIQLKEYIEELCKTIGYSINSDVLITCDLEELSLDIDKAIPVGLAVNEMITNALKHAFRGMKGGQIHVSLHRKAQWELIVKDNGKGLPEHFDPQMLHSIGIRLVQDLAEHQLHGKFSFFNDGGAVFKIEFKPQAA